MSWLALGGLALLLLFLLARAFANARLETVKSLLAWIAGGLALALALTLIVSGRAGQAIWAAALLGPLLYRWVKAVRAARRFGQPGQGSGQSSTVETATLSMTLDHETGRMAGTVRRGPHAGRELADLTLAELLVLRADCLRDDADSVPLIEGWLDRSFPDWRDAAPPAGSAAMTRAEALAILGLAEGASARQIKEAHRRLMAAAHPDHGGSDWLAARINRARDLLLD